LPTTEEINSLKQYCLTQGDIPWNLSSFSDHVAGKSYQLVIDNEQKNSLNTKSDHSSDIKVDLVEQDIHKLSYFDPSAAHDTNVKGKYANLVFHLDTDVMKDANDLKQLNKDSFYSKALHGMVILLKQINIILHSTHMMLYSIPQDKQHNLLSLQSIIL
jgi:hypothetical protein